MANWTRKDWDAYRELNQMEVLFRSRQPTDGQLILFRKLTNSSKYLPGKWDDSNQAVHPFADNESFLPMIHITSLKGWINIDGFLKLKGD
jgi:hypothetical protein